MLVSVTALLLAILAAILAVNNSYTTKIVTDRETDPFDRVEIERNAFAHLQAYAEQKNCTATPDTFSVTGEKDGISYTLDWSKSATGTTLSGSYQRAATHWTTEQLDVELYGETQSASWVLAPYFSEFVEIKYDKDKHHHDHSNHDKAKIKKDGDIVLRSFKLGPLATEPLTLVQAELELFFESANKFENPDELQLNAVRFPWDPKDVTDDKTGLGANSTWKKGNYDKFETVRTDLTMLSNSAKIDFTELLGSWVSGTRPNFGWALTTESTKKTEWLSGPTSINFAQRPRMHIKYRCACGKACVGVDQTEVVALGTLKAVDGYGGEHNKMAKLWLHRAHQQYLVENASSGAILDRTVYYPAGLSEFDVPSTVAGQEITGAHIEPANADHPNHHFYTLLDGKSIDVDLPAFNLSNAHSKQLTYYQSPANKPIGDSSLELRRMPTPTSGTLATQQPVSTYVSDANTFVGGYSYFDNRYWFGTQLNGVIKTQDFPVKDDTASVTAVHTADIGRASLALPVLSFNANHTIDALHVIDKYNYLISGEYYDTTEWEVELGRRQFHDGDIVLYNTITQKARLIDGEISRSNGNNVSAIALYKEPIPASGSTESEFEEAFPFLY